MVRMAIGCQLPIVQFGIALRQPTAWPTTALFTRYNSRMRHPIAAAFFCFSAAFAASTPTIDESLSMKSAGGAQISPDGRFVAYAVQQANWDENDFISQIWLANTATGDRFQLTSGKKSSGNPQWSPDSRRLAFTSNRDGKSQIYIISPSGGEAVQLTNEENGAGGIAWS